MAGLPAIGIDISEFNGDVDIAALKGQIEFVIIRCGYGSDFVSQDDSQYENNVRKCEEAGVPYGVYLYSYAQNEAMARSEAAHTLRLLRGKRPLYGVWYDVEDSTLPDGEQIIDNCVTYCRAIEDAGFYCGIYSFLYWLETRLDSPRLDPFDKWVAQWNDTLDYEGPFGMWQFTNNGILNGRRFDMDRAYRDYPAIIEGMEVTDLTRDQIIALARDEAQRVYNQNESRYTTIDDLPTWAREAARQVYDELELGGAGTTEEGDMKINASFTFARVLTIVAKVLDRIAGEAAAEETGDGALAEPETPEET